MKGRFFVLIMIVLCACNAHDRQAEYYSDNKRTTLALYNSYKEIESSMAIKRLNIRKYDRHKISVNLAVNVSRNVGFFYTIDDHKLMPIALPPRQFEDSVSQKNYVRTIGLVESDRFQKFLIDVVESEYRGVAADSTWFFITLGDDARRSSHPDMETGLLIISDTSFRETSSVIKKLDHNVYLYEGVVH